MNNENRPSIEQLQGIANNGLVAYFDVLGFTHIAASDNIVQAAQLVTQNILQARQRIEEQVHSDPSKSYFTAQTDWVIFADSILIHSSVPHDHAVFRPESNEALLASGACWYRFLAIYSELLKGMFNAGLPLRGAISQGRFLTMDRCFVGKPITDCIQLANATEWSGCVVSPTASETLRTILMSHEIYRSNTQQLLVEVEVPFKRACPWRGQTRQRQLAIKWFPVGSCERGACLDPGLEHRVRQSFQAHSKPVGKKEEPKVQNTARFLEYIDRLFVNLNEKRPLQGSRTRI